MSSSSDTVQTVVLLGLLVAAPFILMKTRQAKCAAITNCATCNSTPFCAYSAEGACEAVLVPRVTASCKPVDPGIASVTGSGTGTGTGTGVDPMTLPPTVTDINRLVKNRPLYLVNLGTRQALTADTSGGVTLYVAPFTRSPTQQFIVTDEGHIQSVTQKGYLTVERVDPTADWYYLNNPALPLQNECTLVFRQTDLCETVRTAGDVVRLRSVADKKDINFGLQASGGRIVQPFAWGGDVVKTYREATERAGTGDVSFSTWNERWAVSFPPDGLGMHLFIVPWSEIAKMKRSDLADLSKLPYAQHGLAADPSHRDMVPVYYRQSLEVSSDWTATRSSLADRWFCELAL